MKAVRKKVVALMLVILIAGAFFVFGAYGWFLKKQARVLSGMANPHFPYRDYSAQELEKMWPQDGYASVPTTRTPEQTHALFLENLKKGDLTAAVECCFRKGDWEEMKGGLENIKKNGKLNLMTSDLENIKQEMLLDSVATYSYLGTLKGEKGTNLMEFIKNSEGVWLIKCFLPCLFYWF